MVGLQRVEGHVGCGVCRLRIVFESRKVQCVGYRDVQFRFFSYGSRVERRLHVEVVGEIDIILRFGTCGARCEQQCYGENAFKHA